MSTKKNGPIIIICVLIVLGAGCAFTGCINSAPTPTNQSTPQTTLSSTTPPPNPYGLDSDGYYIADFGYNSKYTEPLTLGPHTDLTEEINYIKKYHPNFPTPAFFNVTCPYHKISSGGFVTFEGTTNLPVNTSIQIDVSPTLAGLHQIFSAPVLPGFNATNIVKVKIPALNIHVGTLDCEEYLTDRVYETGIAFGPVGAWITITADPTHPMIVERNQCQTPRGGLYCNTTNIWWWTNNTSSKHVWDADDPLYENGKIQPFPTYPRPNRTCLKQMADGSGDVLVVC